MRVVGDASKFNKTMDDVQGKMSKFGGGVAKVGKAAAVGTAAAGAAAFVIGQEVLGTGAKLTSWRQKTSTVFERSAKDVRKWADANNEAFGVTDDELAGMAAGFGDLLKPMGFTSKEAAGMAKDVVGLSGALSEWSGGSRSAAEVSEILSKAMLGERDGLKELGISISEADVQARLAAKGQGELTGAALEQAKAVATQELIFEKSTDAQKAYAEGGNEALRAQNNLKATVGELREQFAERLLPAVTEITQWMADNLPGALDKVGQVAADLKARWDEIFPTLKTAVETAVTAITATFEVLREVFTVAFDVIQAIVSTFVTVATELWSRFGDTIVTFATSAWDRITGLISAALEIITGVWTTFAGVFTGDWGKAWDGIKQVLSGVWDAIKELVGLALDSLKYIIGMALAAIDLAWDTAWDGIKKTVSTVWDGIKTAVSDAIELVKTTIGGALDAIKTTWGEAWAGIKTVVSEAWDGIKTAVSGAIDAVVEIVAAIPGRIASAASGAFDGIYEAFKGAINSIVRAWNNFKLGPWSLPRIEVDMGPLGSIGVGGQTIGPWETPNIPTLATGNVAKRPTFAMFGEYPGAFNNPEITAPEATIRKLLREEMGASTGARGAPVMANAGAGTPDMDYWREAGRVQAQAYARTLQQLQRAG